MAVAAVPQSGLRIICAGLISKIRAGRDGVKVALHKPRARATGHGEVEVRSGEFRHGQAPTKMSEGRRARRVHSKGAHQGWRRGHGHATTRRARLNTSADGGGTPNARTQQGGGSRAGSRGDGRTSSPWELLEQRAPASREPRGRGRLLGKGYVKDLPRSKYEGDKEKELGRWEDNGEFRFFFSNL
jgi:hypothetical protein